MKAVNTCTTKVIDRRQRELPANAARYAICVQGQLDPHWSECLDGMTITYTESFDSILSGTIADQAALHGLLAKIRDLNLTLVSVTRLEGGRSDQDRDGS